MRVLISTIVLLAVVAPAASAAQTYTVRSGDTLWSIASRYHVSVEAIARASGLADVDALLQPGQRLVIPVSSSPHVATTSTPASRTERYEVRAGDTLWAIASRYHVPIEAIARASGLTGVDAVLQPGQRLVIPVSSSPPAAARSAPAYKIERYEVKPGDTLWVLARRFGMGVRDLAALNGIGVESTLRIGQILKVKAPGIRATPAAASPQAPTAAPAASTVKARALPYRGTQWAGSLIGLSRRFIGTRYRWGATGPSAFDCSGFLQYVYARMDVSLPRTTYAMYYAGRPVPAGELKPGDMVFFTTYRRGPSHAGIYIGEGQFIHSSSAYGSVTITPLSKDYYRKRYLGARRF
ncbi:MAG: LysM peptidoglycan-binding domain-containing protein [Armatimonadetes bacterium]|nr:LysM peptidoglycan-binding domain-containing protein [Armatimonadota bacterium]